MPELRLTGCTAEPLGAYLKGLGVLRIVGEQADPDVAAWWDGDRFVLRSRFELDELERFLIEDYVPAPLVAPWNGGSGFYPKDQKAGIDAIKASSHTRLAAYRETIARCVELVGMDAWEDLDKADQVRLCRAQLPDEAVRWLDAAVVLTTDGREFPPILGTGGNVGRLEFSNNFMQRLAEVLPPLASSNDARSRSEAWLRDALSGSAEQARLKAAVGQLDPGATGGANSDPVEAAGVSLVNPWDYVLSMEGALLFASGAARRMGSTATGRAAMPFMVDSAAVGYASGADQEKARGELWAPLWGRPAGCLEIERLFSEGRGDWKGKQARTGLDFARAVATLGVDRGIDAFVRHAFVERHGQNMLAVPVARVRLAGSPRPDVSLTASLDDWLERVRRIPNVPAAIRSALRRVEIALWYLATEQREHRAETLQQVLIEAARLDAALGRSSRAQEKVRPCPRLPADDWVTFLDDGSRELRLAVAFASQRDDARRWPITPNAAGVRAPGQRPALMLRPVHERGSKRDLEWSGKPAAVPGLDARSLTELLAEVLQRRSIAASSRPSIDQVGSVEDDAGQRGVQPAFDYHTCAPAEDVVAFLNGDVDDDKLRALLGATLLLDFANGASLSRPDATDELAAPPAYSLLAPFFHGGGLQLAPDVTVALAPGADWVTRLSSGHRVQLESVVTDALRRLRIAKIVPLLRGSDVIAASVTHPQRLLASLAFPISGMAAARLLRRVASTRDHLVTT